ncbi:glutathione peroxidase [Salipiger sp. H15]|uniref:Glutathione peroxidase n=1 Tax=Alloyangia sp. H15 TaxID=3029062 RepID=A0AAU8AE39_9RHOB
MRALSLVAVLATCALPALASETTVFESIDGGNLDLESWRGRPVLVVNTASRCGFTPQYDGLQALYDRYRARGLVVLAVPSNDFRQELGSEAEVKDFCEINFDLDLPMTTITHVTGAEAHPFYRELAEEEGFAPSWNFNKVLIGPEGEFVAGWGSTTLPLSEPITGTIEPLLD